MVKILSLALLIVAVTAVAVPNDDWKNQYKCPAPVTKIEYKEKYVTKTETKYDVKYETKYETKYATKTETKKEYVTPAPVVKYVYKECEKKDGWGDHN